MVKSVAFVLVASCAALLSVTALAALPAIGPRSAASPAARAIGTALHGHWVINVSEADGRPVSRTEFTNDLTPEGQRMLVNLMLGRHYAERWEVSLHGAPGAAAPCSGAGGACRFGTAPDGRTAGRITLGGTVDMDSDSRIGQVRTWLTTCTLTELRSRTYNLGEDWDHSYVLRDPRPCQLDAWEDDFAFQARNWATIARETQPFTQATLPAPVEVSRGQFVSASVTLTLAEAGR